MKKIGILAGGLCLIFGLLPSQTLTLTAPDGAEHWPLQSTQNINWTSSGVTAAIKLVLFKGGTAPQYKMGNIAQNLGVANGSYLWKAGSYEGGTAAVGSDYYVRVISMDGTCKDESNTPFSLTFSAAQIQAAEIRLPPRIIRFAINDGAETTAETSVTLNHRVMGGTPTHYRLQIRGHWRGWASYPYPEAPVWNWSPALGENTLVFQVKNEHGESNVATDTIVYSCLQTYSATAADIYNHLKNQGSSIKAVAADMTSQCGVEPATGAVKMRCKGTGAAGHGTGSKCNFEIFMGKNLKEGWKFNSYEYEYLIQDGANQTTTAGADGRVVYRSSDPLFPRPDVLGGFKILSQPVAGSRDIGLKVRTWCDEPPPFTGWFILRSIKLDGPCNRNVWDAF